MHPAHHIPATCTQRVPLIWIEEIIAGGLFGIFIICMALLAIGLS